MKAFSRGFILYVIHALGGEWRKDSMDKPQMKIMRTSCGCEILEDQNCLQNIKEVPAIGKTMQDLY